MSDDATGFVGNIPENYDRGLGPIIFADYAEHTARLVAGYAPSRVLETGAGTGIVTRRLRDLLPATTRLIATDQPADARGRAKEVSPRRADRVPARRCDGIAICRRQLRCGGLPVQR
jgi:predicted O-methyltransferase YrrM